MKITESDLESEQRHVTQAYAKLDAEREATSARLARALRDTGGTPQARTERDVATTMYRERLTQLSGVEAGLCFGRLDFEDGGISHIGRIGLFDEDDGYEPLLIDWRAPAARPFYLATAASPLGVRRRRHLRTRLRRVVGMDDEVLDLDAAAARRTGRDLGLAGEATLLAALNRQRGDAMRDIVATIQAEQDEIIRAELSGVQVVQGGPGTGKTAVALHRAAFLLYEHRNRLASRGVLVVGPNSTFLSYIGHVLPSLGETGVLLATVGELFPGARARGADARATAEIKGRTVMADVLRAAIADRQRVPEEPVEVEVDGDRVTLAPAACAAARDKARRSDKPHNLARRVFLDAMVDALADQVADRLTHDVLDPVDEISYAEGEDPDTEMLDQRDLADIRSELAADPATRRALDSLWPLLTPAEVLADLYTRADRLDRAAGEYLTADERTVLRRGRGRAWTPSDVPLLDELAELLGEDDTEDAEKREQREQLAYAQGVLHVLDQDDEIADEERLRVADVLDAELLAEREQQRSKLTAAERAAADRTWTFGHVIVDEAQELTAMDWRMIMRRCPSRSMTIVGDVAQTSAEGGAASWQQALEPYVADRWRLAELTVNYRTPAEIMDVAAEVLAKLDAGLRPPVSVRETGVPPWREHLAPDTMVERLRELADAERAVVAEGTVAVLCPSSLAAEVRAGVQLDRVSVLTVERAKGLEFDSVIVVEPDQIVASSSRGLSDLYVALTRATQRLGIVCRDSGPQRA
ncbi:MAG: AAA family ATPase [Actinophytocola sp.]|nr:AAA family ATPase [Actinophytocola sp.]